MTRGRLLFAGVFSVASVVPLAYGQESEAMAVRVPENVRDLVTEMLSTAKESFRSKVKRVVFSYRFADMIGSDEWSIHYLPDGLLGINTRSEGVTSVNASRLTIAGLIDIVESAGSESSWVTSTALPIGRGYIPFTLTTKSSSTSRSHLDQLSGRIADAYRPSAGLKFEFSQAKITERSSKTGFIGGASTLKNAFNVGCETSEDKPGAELFAGLRGAYRTVVCNYRNVNGQGSTQSYVYLVDSGLYLKQSMALGSGKTFSWTITAIDYE